MSTIQAGSVLAGKYRVERILGQGGMGMVVAATHLELDKRVALKFLLPHLLQNAELVTRFAREAKAASKIDSEHVVKVLDVGKLEGGAPYMVMEYLEGGDLSQLVKQRGPLPGQDAIEYLLQACEALAQAHAAGIVHRDLKPANLFLTRRPDGSGCIKVLDFGISKVALAPEEAGQGMTQTSAVMGSPSYMAPEQLKSSRNVDARTDIWALGIILHELLTGEVAFKADTVPELYVSILTNPPAQLRARRPDAPPGMEAIIYRCLEKDPARRFQSVAEFAQALGEFGPARARMSVERIQRVMAAAAPRPAAPAPAAPAQLPPHPSQVQGYTMSASQAHPGMPVHPAGPGQSYPSAPPPAAAQSHVSSGGYGAPVAGYAPAAQAPAAGYGAPQPAPIMAAAPAPATSGGGASKTLIWLIVLVVGLVLVGGCVICANLATADHGGPRKRSAAPVDGREGLALVASSRFVRGESEPVPFQRAAGWTTVSPSARARPLTSAPEAPPERRSTGDA